MEHNYSSSMPVSASIDDISEVSIAIQLDYLSTEKSYTVKNSKMIFIFYLLKSKPKSILLDWVEDKNMVRLSDRGSLKY